MTKLDSKLIKIFANNSGDRGTTVFGSAKDNNAQFSKDPNILQNSNYLQGWKGVKLLNKTPLLEDFNTVFYNITRELFYLAQTGGFREWVDDTNSNVEALYNKGSVIGVLENNIPTLYYSLTDNNTGNDPQTDTGTNWKKLYFTRDEITELLAAGVHYRGEVETKDDLPTEAEIGDEYMIGDDGGGNSVFAIWDGVEWDYAKNDLSKIIDGSDLALNNLSEEAADNLIELVKDNLGEFIGLLKVGEYTINSGDTELLINLDNTKTYKIVLEDMRSSSDSNTPYLYLRFGNSSSFATTKYNCDSERLFTGGYDWGHSTYNNTDHIKLNYPDCYVFNSRAFSGEINIPASKGTTYPILYGTSNSVRPSDNYLTTSKFNGMLNIIDYNYTRIRLYLSANVFQSGTVKVYWMS